MIRLAAYTKASLKGANQMKHDQVAPAVLGYIKGKPVYEVRGGEDPENPTATKDKPASMAVVKDELKKALEKHEKDLQATFEKYEKDLKEQGSVSEATKADLKAMADDYKGMRDDVDKILQSQTKFYDGKDITTSPGQEFIDSDEFKTMVEKGGRVSKQYDQPIFMKNTILGEGGSPQDPESVIVQRQEVPGIIPGAFRMLNILDLIPAGVTTSNLIHY